MQSNYKKFKGFTLVELMLTLSIAAIVMTLAVPNMSIFLAQNQSSQQSHDFIAALQLGLSDAENNTAPVVLCAKNPANNTCINYTTSPSLTAWNSGWLLFRDNNSDGAYTDGTDELIKIQVNPSNLVNIAAISSAITITNAGTISRGTGNYEFSPKKCVSNSRHRIIVTASGQFTTQGIACQ